MIGVTAKLNVKPEMAEKFEDVFLTLSEAVRENEPGNILYQLCKDEHGTYVVLEMYESEEALAAHGQSEHFKAAGAGFKGLMSGPPEVKRMPAVTR
ncbi:MAG: antibiotic biosynthesis monooxygenase [Gammaproteobacteria bacterium]|nr:antibiotic biosynthesis monooxygenase [Gammaproteobacteria bacterium]